MVDGRAPTRDRLVHDPGSPFARAPFTMSRTTATRNGRNACVPLSEVEASGRRSRKVCCPDVLVAMMAGLDRVFHRHNVSYGPTQKKVCVGGGLQLPVAYRC